MKYLKLFCILFLLFSGCTYGNKVITGTARSPISPDEVVIYTKCPPQYEEIAIVRAHGAAITIQGCQEKALIQLKKVAAEIGANGLIEVAFDAQNKEFLNAKAIYVPKESK